MAIAINSNQERDQLVASGGQLVFAYSFPVFKDDYLKVYQRANGSVPDDTTQLLTLGVNYTVQGVGQDTGGTITLILPAIAGDIITIVGAEPIDRLSVFQDLNPLTVALNQQLNEMTVMMQQTYTYWNDLTPHYNYDELISAPTVSNPQGVRPFKRILPMLPNGYVWVGRGAINQVPDDIVAMPYLASPGGGNVNALHAGMRPSIALWTGTDFVLTDSNLNIAGDLITPTAGQAANITAGFADTWGAMHWPAHVTGNRPIAPNNGDTYYDTTLQQFFGYEAGSWQPFAMGGSTNTTTFSFTQTPTADPLSNLYLGAAVRMDVASGLWLLTLADNKLDAEFYGFIIAISGAGPAFTYTLQLVGVAPTGLPPLTGLTRGTPQYLSDTVPGGIQSTPPATSGFINYPVIWPVDATTVFIRMSRGFANGGPEPVPAGPAIPPTIIVITQPVHGFSKGDWLYISADSTFSKGIATALATAQVEWVVIAVVDANNFVVQQIGQMTGVVTVDDLGAAITSSDIYYLSRTVAGKLTKVPPSVGQVSKPLYVQQILSTNTGWIMDQRPEIVQSNGGGGGLNLITSINLAGLPTTGGLLLGILNGTYSDITIVGEGIRFLATGGALTGQFTTIGVFMRVEINGVLEVDNNYIGTGIGGVGLATSIPFPGLSTGSPYYGQTYTLAPGHEFNFQVDVKNVNSTTAYKILNLGVEGFSDHTGLPINLSMASKSGSFYYGSQTANTNKYTGFQIFNYNDGINTFEFLQGTLSVYGTAT